jgi:hypothetical protein
MRRNVADFSDKIMRPSKFLEKIAIRSERISLASSRVATRSERVIGLLTVIAQNRAEFGTAAVS